MGECGLHQTGGRRFKLNLPQDSHNRLLNKLLHNRLECMAMIMTTDPPTNFPSSPVFTSVLQLHAASARILTSVQHCFVVPYTGLHDNRKWGL